MQANKEVKKLYYSIGEVSEITGLKQYVLRYWESEFSQLNPSKNSAGNRNYRKADIDLINEIKDLLYDRRFTIKGAKQHLKDKAKQGSSTTISHDQVKTIKEKVIKLTAADLKTLKRIKSGLEDLLQLVDNLK
jgi:DNA-binding transcriptional MerR regulator|tara:strand:- start:978 stop:1376 length:399 start_codon:yes stop_codon:yes gene_type:complete